MESKRKEGNMQGYDDENDGYLEEIQADARAEAPAPIASRKAPEPCRCVYPDKCFCDKDSDDLGIEV